MFARTVESLPDGLNLPGEKYCAAKLTDDQLLRIINLRPRDDDNVLNIWKRIPESIDAQQTIQNLSNSVNEFTAEDERLNIEAPVVVAKDDLAVAYAIHDDESVAPAAGGRRGAMTPRITAEAMREREALMERVVTLDQHIHQAPVPEIMAELAARGWTPSAPRSDLLAEQGLTPPPPRGRGGSRGGGTKRKTKRVRRKTKRKSKKRRTRRTKR